MDVRKCFQEGLWMGLGAAASRVCFNTTSVIEEFLCLSPSAHFSTMTELHLSTGGVKMNKSPQKCKVNGKKQIVGFMVVWFVCFSSAAGCESVV